jgi:hypothetical protein
MIVDAAASDLGNQDFLGTMLSREKALSLPVSKEAFSIVDRVIEDDRRVKEFIKQYHPSAT